MSTPIPPIPSVRTIPHELLKSALWPKIRQIRPSKEDGSIEPIFTENSPRSPANTVGGTRLLSLKFKTITPAHRHKKEKNKEKWYIGGINLGGSVVVFQEIDGQWQKFPLIQGGIVIVPPGTSHAICCLDVFLGYEVATVTVITSNTEDDVEWQEPDPE